jgi:A/G-specific adenine glycosylase
MTDETARTLIDWYHQNRRALPWRETRDPYRIWISEVILQQTRVAQGLDYFHRFIARFPDVRALAEAPLDAVLRQWQGLGYYSRARNLHAAAGEVEARFGGVFPDTYEGIRSLKGVGDYTAAAIASFAFGLPHATVDGNVFRWLSRLYDIDIPIDSGEGKKSFTALAQSLLPPGRAAVFNQAAMEFGALQCVPKSPDCPACPFADRCLARAKGSVDRRPVKKGKTAVTPRWFNYLVIRSGGEVLLGRRTAKDIWQNLYEFPLIETARAVDFSELQALPEFRKLFDGVGETVLQGVVPMPKHVLSHRVIHAVFYEFSIDGFSAAMRADYLRVSEKVLGDYPVSRLIELYFLKMK